MLWAFGMPAALFALHRYLEDRRRGWLAAFAAAWLVQALSNGYYLLFFPLLVAAWVLWFTAQTRRADTATIAGAWAVASLVLVPFLIGYQRIQQAFGLERGIGEIEQFSADATGLFGASPNVRLWSALSGWARPEGELFPGALALVLVAAGAIVAARHTLRPSPTQPPRLRRTRIALWTLVAVAVFAALSVVVHGPWQLAAGRTVWLSVSAADKPLSVALVAATVAIVLGPTFAQLWRRQSAFAFYAFGAVAMFALSLGPRARIGGTSFLFRAPYAWLLALPGFAGVRVPGRMAMLFVLCVAVAAALAFDRLTSTAARRTRQALALLAGALVIVEGWPSISMASVPAAMPNLARLNADGAVLELPIGITERDIAAVYRSMTHDRPLVNGYSGYVPPHYLVLRAALQREDVDTFAELASHGPLTVILDRDEQYARWSKFVERAGATLVSDERAWVVYRIPEASVAPDDVSGEPLSIRSVVANTGADWANRMIDGDPRTEWNSRRVQAGDEEVLVDLGQPRAVSAVRLALGPFVSDFPRQLVVDCEASDGVWDECWRGSSTALTLRAAIADPRLVPLTIPIGRAAVRRLRLRQTAPDPQNGWSISELTVIGGR
jgi:hypothetical protein